MVLGLLNLGLRLSALVRVHRGPMQPGSRFGQPEIVFGSSHCQLGCLDVLLRYATLVKENDSPVVGCFGGPQVCLSIPDGFLVLGVRLRNRAPAQRFEAMPGFLQRTLRLSPLGLKVPCLEYRQYLAGLYLLVLYYSHRLDLRGDF